MRISRKLNKRHARKNAIIKQLLAEREEIIVNSIKREGEIRRELEAQMYSYKWNFLKLNAEKKHFAKAALAIQADLDKAILKMRDHDIVVRAIKNLTGNG